MTVRQRVLAFLLAVAWLLAAVASVSAAEPTTSPPPGPPFPEPVNDQAVYDYAGVLDGSTILRAEQIIDAIEKQTAAEIVVYTQNLGRDDVTTEEAERDAAALMDEWGVGRAGINDGLVILFDLDTTLEHGQVQLYAGSGFASSYLSQDELQAVFDTGMLPYLRDGDLDTALLVALARIITATLDEAPTGEPGGAPVSVGPPPGPPYPEPEIDRAVYDFAGIFRGETLVDAESVIDTIEARTGAEVVIYTQQAGYYNITTGETETRARALIDQWGIGRAGFDDALVIFFDLDPSLLHGQVQLYAAPGFEAAYLTNSERQGIFDNDMLPLLLEADFDGALAVALEKIDAAATAEHAAELQGARQFNAVLGLVGAPVAFMSLAGWAVWNWRRFGKDPTYLDDPSILMPAPPPGLTAASGAMVTDGKTSRRALTTAMLDLASRGEISFREDGGFLGLGKKVGIDTQPPKGDELIEAQRTRNARRPLSPAEDMALRRLRSIGGDEGGTYISPDELPKFGQHVSAFDEALERNVVAGGWFKERPSKVVTRWAGRGFFPLFAGIVAIFIGVNIPISGLVLIGGAMVAGGLVLLGLAKAMPAVTMPGAMVRAMLAAYRRTLEKTMAQARSMQQVVDEAGLDWLDTPDQAVVWGTALGLQDEIEQVLARSLEDAQRGQTSSGFAPYFPSWYQGSSGAPLTAATASGSGGGLFSNSGAPNLGGMMSALGTIGNSPSSSGGSGGGFGGGSSGGGGGGSGGGF